MNRLKESGKLIIYNWKPLLAFEIIYKLVAVIIFAPLTTAIYDLIMKATGYSYLTLENYVSFMTHPLTIVMLIVLLLIITFYAMIDISAIIFTLDQSKQEQKAHFSHIVKFSFKNALRVWKPNNFMLIIFVVLLLPLLGIGLASGVVTTISIPEFILDYIKSNTVLYIGLCAVAGFLITVMMKWLFSFHYFTLEGCNFKEARKKSCALGHKKRIIDFILIVLIQVILWAIYLGLVFASIALASLIGNLFSGVFALKWILSTCIWIAAMISIAVVAIIAVPVTYGCVSSLYYHHKEERNEQIIHIEAPPYNKNERQTKVLQGIGVAVGVIGLVACFVVGYFVTSGKLNPEIEYVRNMQITAHRGASVFYPENTMSAFRGAKELGADWVELDVQQSKDGQIIVSHDTNFSRVAGVDANTWDMTYEEIEKLDAGSFFSKEFAGEKIPLLSEVVQFAKENNMKLNIELKPTGHETDFEKDVIDIINEAGLQKDCVITSQVYEVLENVKAYDDSITTVYVMSLAYGDISELTAADDFSIEASNVTQDLVSKLHNEGKEIYAWTVNTEDSILEMIDMNVDNIITDNIELAKKCVNESKYSDWLTEYLKLLK